MYKYLDEREKIIWWKGIGISLFIFVILLTGILFFFEDKFSSALFPMGISLALSTIFTYIYQYVNDIPFYSFSITPGDTELPLQWFLLAFVWVVGALYQEFHSIVRSEWDGACNIIVMTSFMILAIISGIQWYQHNHTAK